MLSVVFIVTVVFVALILVVRRVWWRKGPAQRLQGGIPQETLALEAFMQGNAYMAAEKFPEAMAAFHRARELDPKRPHVVDRLAEVARRQHAATATRPAA
jgi:cytochrome c-type biogenesis protein CcmH/NrfG